MGTFIVTLLVNSVIMSALALLYMAVSPKLAKRYRAKWVYYAWLIIVIGLIIPIRPSFETAAIQIEVPRNINADSQTMAPPTQISGTDENDETTTALGIPTTADSEAAADSETATNSETTANSEQVNNPNDTIPTRESATIPWSTILVMVWLFGAVLVLFCHAIRHKRFIRSIWRWGEDVSDSRTLNIWRTVLKEMKITAQIGLQRSELTGSPLLTGILYPRIMLPKTDIPDDEMALILKHELVHFKRKDLWYKSLVLLAIAIHWFNPMVYIIAKTISLQCERSCDDEVIKYKDSDSRLEYSAAIIHSIRYAESTTALSTNFFGGKNEMKNRISSIMDMSRKKRGTLVICAVLMITMLIGCFYEINAGVADDVPSEGVSTGVIFDITPPESPEPPSNEDISENDEQARIETVRQTLAGFWRMDWPNPANAQIYVLSADGRWESPGPLPIDATVGGSFVIASEESGIYRIRFTIEQSTDSQTEIGHEFDNYFYDVQNDLLFAVFGSGEGDKITEFIRENDLASLYENMFASPYSLTFSKTNADAGSVYTFERLGFSFTIPHSWGDMYEVDGDDTGRYGDGFVTVDFRAGDTSMRLFWISLYDADLWDIDGWDIIQTFNAGNAEYMILIDSWQRSAMREHDWIGEHRETVETMLHESDTLVADSVVGR